MVAAQGLALTSNKMAEAKQGFEFRNTPSIIIESASSAASRVWSWVKQKFPGDEYDVDEDSVVENRHAGIQLKSILKKDAKKKEKRDRKVSRMSSILDRMLEFMRLETKRREREAAPHRKGPIPMQDLPVSDRRQSKQTHATLNPGKLTSLDGKNHVYIILNQSINQSINQSVHHLYNKKGFLCRRMNQKNS